MKNLRINVPYKILAIFGPDPCGDNGKDEVIYHCPQCIIRKGSPDLKGKLYVNTKSYKFQCFRCGYKGHISDNLKIDKNKIYDEDKDIETERLIKDFTEVLSGENKFSLKIPLNSVFDSKQAVEYLINRRFTEKQIEYYDLRLGIFKQEFGRIIIPNEVHKLVYTDFYSARTYTDQTPKYHNPGKQKSKTVFNLFRQKEGEPIIIVEGALTAIAAGYHAVATLGKTITLDQASQIISKHPSKIYVNYDYGAEHFAEEVCKLLKSLTPDTPIYNVLMKDDRDAADLTKEEYAECLKNAIEYLPLYNDIESLINIS